ncbi:MAG: sulfite exporter TauE/SafE family protein [Thermodesulfobacteriota bacterium]
MRKKAFLIMGIMVVLAVAATLVWVEPSLAQKVEDAIAQTPVGTGKGQIDPDAPKGLLGIPGAPQPFWLWCILWGIWVGWIFSTVGAFGGIMAGVGHITVFGLRAFGDQFKDTSPVMNKLMTDTIRVSNQYLVGLSALISSINYYRMGRLVLPLGAALAIGSISGAYIIPWLTAGKIKLSSYIGYFGLAVFAIAFVLFYDTTEKGQASKKQAKAAAKAFEDSVKAKTTGGEVAELGAKVTQFSLTRVRFTFYGVEFSFNPLWPILGGFIIAAISAFLGIGGGFLYVPYCTSIVGLPMYLVAGTSALAVLISMITSIFSYMVVQKIPVDFLMVGTELVGIFIGSIVGPYTSKYIPDIWLKRLFVLLAIYVGLRYVSKGFFGYSIVPPFG